MDESQSLRGHLLALLDGRQAYLTFEEIVSGIPFELQGIKPENAPHTLWQLMEHLRIAQWDILEFSRNPQHVSPAFPTGYWPAAPKPPSQEAWSQSVSRFRSDLSAMKDLVANPETDLFQPIPHGSGQTILREALLIAVHNAYHLGQVVLMRRLLGSPPAGL